MPALSSGPRLANTIATLFGVGRLPGMPGTWGSAVAVILAWPLMATSGPAALAVATLLILGIGYWAAESYSRATGLADPSEVVIDEVAGQWIALLPAATDPLLFVLAFFAFRVADIAKFWPVNKLERLPGGIGIMADDVAAGIYAAAVVWAAGLLLN